MKRSDRARKLVGRTPAGSKAPANRAKRGASYPVAEGLEGRRLLAAELFFAATNGPTVDGRELWSYTGTGSPVRRSQIRAGGADGNPQELSPYVGRIYFSADDGVSGRELYTFNGTSSVRVADINIGAGSSSPEGLTLYNGQLYFAADDGVSGSELWRYNATTNVAQRVADINLTAGPAGTASAGSLPLDLHVFNNKLYFSASNGTTGNTNGRELWVYDSTTNQASMVADIRPGTANGSPNGMITFQNQLYFEVNNGTVGSELYRYSGTGSPTLAKDIQAGVNGSNPANFSVFNNKLYFSADGGGTVGTELWSFDGTNAALVADIYNVPNANPPAGSFPGNLTVFSNRLYFTASRGDGNKLYAYNGTSAPVIIDEPFYPLDGIGASVVDPVVFNNELYFGVGNSNNKDGELYKYSGSGTIQLVANLYPGTSFVPGFGNLPNPSNPSTLVVVDSSNFAPIISDITNQTVSPNTSRTVNFTVSDTETAAGSLSVTAASSNTSVVPQAGLVFGGSGGNRTLQVTPTAGLTSGTSTITVTVTDAGGLTATDTFVVTIAVQNNAPVLDVSGNPTFDTIPEDPSTNNGLDIPTLISRLGGTKITDANPGALQGIAITGATTTNGVWQYSTNSGGAWQSIGGVADGLARLLTSNAATRVRFVPNAHFFGVVTPGLTFRAWDQTAGTNGGTADTRVNGGETAFSVNAETMGITVTSVNDTPDAVNDAASTDKSLSRIVNVKANDTDADGEAFNVDRINNATFTTGTAIALPSGARVTVNANQTFTYNPNGAFNGLAQNATATDTFTYRISDAAGANDTATVTITITNSAITVNTFADTIDTNANVTSLREAIIAANATNTDQTIILPAGTYALTRTGSLEQAASTGDLDVTDTVGRTIVSGASAATTAIDANGLGDRIFQVFTGASLELINLTVRNGRASDNGTTGSTASAFAAGGAVFNEGTLTATGVTFQSNTAQGVQGANGIDGFRGPGPTGPTHFHGPTAGLAGSPGRGGAIYSTGTVNVNGSTFQSNSAVGGQGGRGGTPYTEPSDPGNAPGDGRVRGAVGGAGAEGEGGAIYSSGATNMQGGTLNQNTAAGGRGGDGSDGAPLRGTENGGGNGGVGGAGRGGAFYLAGAVTHTIGTIQASGNAANGAAGGDGGDRGTQPGGPYAGTPEPGGNGGNGGAGQGGGIYTAGSFVATLGSSLLNANSAKGGTGGAFGTFPTGQQFGSSNGAVGTTGSGDGGAAHHTAAFFTYSNSTFSGNTAGVSTPGRGGGLFMPGGTVNLVQVTVAANTAATSAGGFGTLGGTATLVNTLIGDNTAPTSPDVSGAFTASRNNLVENGAGMTGVTNGTNSNQVGVDPRMGPLASNGGAFQTHALLISSPAFDAADPAGAAGLSTDLRGVGFNRIADSADAGLVDTPDIGAFEAQVSIQDVANAATNEDTPAVITFNVGDVDLLSSITASSSNTALVPNANVAIVANPDGTRKLTATPLADKNGMSTITLTVTGPNGQSMTDTFVLTVNAVNDAPQFTKGADVTVNEDAGAQILGSWATNILRGPATATDETGQSILFVVSIAGTTGGLTFATPPAVSNTGVLSFNPAANSFGTATINVSLSDDGGNVAPNVNTSPTQTFTITVNPINDAPTLAATPNPAAILEDAAQQTINLSQITMGAPNEGQTLTVTATSSNPSLIPNPAVTYANPNATGTLTYTPVANANGTATITVTVTDSGSNAAPNVNVITRTFDVVVTAVNDAPSFTPGPNQAVISGSGAVSLPNWVAAFNRGGGADEATQAVLGYQITGNTAPGIFAVAPAISSAGTLTFTPAAGITTPTTATITATVRDNGGTTPGVDTSAAQTFTITVNPVPDLTAPRVTGVFVDSADWTAPFRASVATAALGSSTLGFQILGGTPNLDELPWVNLNRVRIQFSENVVVDAADLVVRGVNVPAYALDAASFSYDAVTFTATWALPAGTFFNNDKVLLDLNADAGGVTDNAAAPNALDGEFTSGTSSFPSGNGTAGGDFRFRFNVLPGDANRSGGSVIGSDVTLVRNAQNATPGAAGSLYNIFKDVNGSNSIVGSDVTAVRNRQGLSLPAGEPVIPAPILAEQVVGGQQSVVTPVSAAVLRDDGAVSLKKKRLSEDLL